jgi:NADPH-dependent 2,4-dienoyl-CoA reductase/sulfur reductase-like enzyme
VTIFIPEPHLLDSPRGRPWPAYPVPHAGIRTDEPPSTTDVVIVGAGPAGLAVASALWHLGVHDVVLLDRADRPCARFFDRIDVLRQRVLRSPYAHHPGVEGYRDCELLDFARLHWAQLTAVERREVRMAQAGHRSVVPVDVFEAYCRHVATVHGVYRRTWRASVHSVRPGAGGASIHTEGQAVRARYAVLCTGEERRPAPPAWWRGRPAAGARPGASPDGVGYWDEPVPAGAGSVVVVGAGLTAAHLIANALEAGQQVDWVLRAARERYQCSDVNAAFFRAEGRARFDGVTWEDRLALMRRERRASIMFEFRPMLRAAEVDGRLTVHRGREVAAVMSEADRPATVLLAGGDAVTGDHVLLATGTEFTPGTRLLPDDVVNSRDGWPDLDERTLGYRRAPRVFTVGAAAGMVLGPAARNIDGHRVATARVAAAIAADLGAVAHLGGGAVLGTDADLAAADLGAGGAARGVTGV